jgi:hypothetical protein
MSNQRRKRLCARLSKQPQYRLCSATGRLLPAASPSCHPADFVVCLKKRVRFSLKKCKDSIILKKSLHGRAISCKGKNQKAAPRAGPWRRFLGKQQNQQGDKKEKQRERGAPLLRTSCIAVALTTESTAACAVGLTSVAAAAVFTALRSAFGHGVLAVAVVGGGAGAFAVVKDAVSVSAAGAGAVVFAGSGAASAGAAVC